ncbi:major facilitator superfamily domain-containing protein [Myxozyma melibiosi]|uniref:Major facilitator superfamily domain-containing protein n=1 Tax=Myxozyma melibiosi TaxID=54550 RepID=A0ABR1F4U7_9ASCO
MGLSDTLKISTTEKNAVAVDAVELDQYSGAESDDAQTAQTTAYTTDGKKTWRERLAWYDPGMDKREKMLLFKIDCLILTYTCIASFSLNLDINNVKNAYVSGMKEDLDLVGNELNYLTVINQAPYCVFMIPGTLLLTRFRPSVILPICEVGWGVFTVTCAFIHSLNELYAFRFMVGFFGAISYSGSIFIIGSWYKKSEVSRRLGLYAVSSPLGSMFSGYLQSAAYTNLNGTNGLEGWRWLFIICALITFPCAIWGAVAIPDQPRNTRCWFLTKEDRELANQRMESEGVQSVKTRFEWSTVIKCMTYWKWYLFVGAWCLLDQNEQGLTVPITLYLKAHSDRFSVPQINNIPTVVNAISVVATLIATWYADKTSKPFIPSVMVVVLFSVAQYMLLAWNISEKAKFFAWFISGVINAMQALLMTWASVETRSDPDERAFIVSSMNCLGNLLKTGTNIVCFPTVDAPRFKTGFLWMSITGTIMIVWIPVLQLFTMWEHRKVARLEGERVEDVENIEASQRESASELNMAEK